MHFFWLVFVFISSVSIPVSYVYAEDMPRGNAALLTGEKSTHNNAPVIIDGRTLFRVYGVSTYPAKQRAAKIAGEIIRLARDPSFDPATIEVKEQDGIVTIFAGDEILFGVFTEDARIEGDIPLMVLAKVLFVPKITQAIQDYRSEREKKVLFQKGLRALFRTIILSGLLFLIFWSFKKTDQLLEKRFKRKIEELEAKSKSVLKAQQIWSMLKALFSLSRTAIVLAVAYLFINFVLELFPWTRYLSQTLLGYVINPLIAIWQAILAYLPNLFFLAILYFLFRYLLRLTYAFFQGVTHGQIKLPDFDAEWAVPTYRIVRFFILILAAVLAYPYIPGSDSEAFKGVSILLGVIFSLGSTSLISNILAGHTMTYRRAFKVGDRVRIGNNVGDVTEIRLMVTHLRTVKNEEVVIPNSVILSGEITNYSSLAEQNGLILHTTVGIGYEVPWRQVEAMLLKAAERTEGLDREYQSFVLQTGLGDFSITYELNVFCSNVKRMAKIYSDLHRNIQDVFNEYNVAIMTPHYVGDPEVPKYVPRENWYASPANQSQSDEEDKSNE